MVAEYHMGANILLAYFHYCNKGGYPFGPEGDKADIVTVANLTPKQKTYVDKTRKHVRMNSKFFPPRVIGTWDMRECDIMANGRIWENRY
jgi:hypothetical protein